MKNKLTIGIGLVMATSMGVVLVVGSILPKTISKTILAAIPIPITLAQQMPEFIITWKANNYAPSEYQGKILPAKGTAVNVSIELVEKGKLANLSAYEVRWFADDELQTAGFGMKNFNFEIDTFTGKSSVLVKAEIINYRKTNLEKIILIPIAEPELTITRLDKNTFKALPYFFNVSTINDLGFIWSINDVSTSGLVEEPDFLSLDLAKINAGTSLVLNLLVENPENLMEKINKSLNFIVQ